MDKLLNQAHRLHQRLHIKLTDGLQLHGHVSKPVGSEFPEVFEFNGDIGAVYVSVNHVVHVAYINY